MGKYHNVERVDFNKDTLSGYGIQWPRRQIPGRVNAIRNKIR